MVRFDLRSNSPRSLVSMSSITTRPVAGSISRNRPKVRELLPAPVRPTMPI